VVVSIGLGEGDLFIVCMRVVMVEVTGWDWISIQKTLGSLDVVCE
jgi:hypothetical protein